MLVKPKKKILAWSDSAIAGTGFGVVSKHVLGALHATGKYEIKHLAINFHGDFTDRSQVPWEQQPARLLDPKDPHGTKMFMRSLVKGNYDYVWVCNDLYITHQVAHMVPKIRQRAIAQGKKPPIFIYYYPIDCHAPHDGSDFMKVVDIPVCYTDHGRAETLITAPEVKGRLQQIPHGVDSKSFRPLAQKDILSIREQVMKAPPDATVVLNFNRNSQRKQLHYSMLAFKKFKEQVPKAVMYLHTAVKDQGGDLMSTVTELGLDPKRDIVFPVRYGPSNPAPVHVLNQLYNMGDIFLTTHLGEGWGLTITEAMAAGVPVVAPDNTCMPQQLGEDGERGYIYPCEDQLWIDQSGFRPKGLLPDIVEMMMEAYKDGPKRKNKIVKLARQYAEAHDWSKVTKAWVSLFENADYLKQDTSASIHGEEI